MVWARTTLVMPSWAAAIVLATLPRKPRRVRVSHCNNAVVTVMMGSFPDCSMVSRTGGYQHPSVPLDEFNPSEWCG